jgi:hypothetical protein
MQVERDAASTLWGLPSLDREGGRRTAVKQGDIEAQQIESLCRSGHGPTLPRWDERPSTTAAALARALS